MSFTAAIHQGAVTATSSLVDEEIICYEASHNKRVQLIIFSFCFTFPTDDNKFSEATAALFTWVDRGEVSRRNANHFYSMIQSANSHVRRLMAEKAQHEEELESAKETFKNALTAILTQCKNTSSPSSASLFLTRTVVAMTSGEFYHRCQQAEWKPEALSGQSQVESRALQDSLFQFLHVWNKHQKSNLSTTTLKEDAVTQ